MTGKFQDYIKATIDNRGKNPSQYYEMGKYPVIDNVLIKNTLYPDLTAVTRYIDQATFDNFLRGYVHKNMPLITLVGNGIGNVTLAPSSDVAIVQNTIGFDVTDDLDEVFLFYWLRNNQGRIKNFNRGSGQPSIKKTDILAMDVDFPEIQYQKKIANILMSIDNKIECNNSINRNLSEQAQAYFDELFVQNASADWKEGTLSAVGTVVAGGTPSKAKEEYYAEKGIAWITPKDLSIDKSVFISHGENDISELGYEKSSATKMPAGTVLFSSRAPIGYIAIAANEVTTNQGFKSVVPHENVGTAYIYFLLKQLLPTIENMASGSTFKEISGSAMKIVPTVIPDDETLMRFNEFCTPILQQVQKHENESKRLAELRDSLLPKLMSGELDVSDLDI